VEKKSKKPVKKKLPEENLPEIDDAEEPSDLEEGGPEPDREIEDREEEF